MLDGSVILVHGLGGDSRTTWEAKGPNNKTVNWVTDKDFLPAELPNARIFTYGYNANIWKDRVTSRVEDHADGLRGGLLTYRRKCKVSYRVLKDLIGKAPLIGWYRTVPFSGSVILLVGQLLNE